MNLNYEINKAFLFVLLTFVISYIWFYSKNLEDQVSESQRSLAAIDHKIHQVKNLDVELLKEEIQNKITIETTSNGFKNISLNAFSANICKLNKRINLEFVADGSSNSGEPTTMKVSAFCKSDKNETDLASIQIPFELIKKMKPSDQRMVFDNSANNEKTATVIEFKNTTDSWPKFWILKSVSFADEKSLTKIVHFNSEDNNVDKMTVLEF